MPGLRSLRNRLAVIFALIILGAIGTIYLSVTPRLQAPLTKPRMDGLPPRSRQYAPSVVGQLLRATNDATGGNRRTEAARIKAARAKAVRKFAERVATEIL